MKHIGIDGNEANVIHRVGSNQYAYGLLQGMYSLHSEGIKFTIYLKSKPVADMPRETSWWQYRVIPPGFAWTQWRLPLELWKPWHRPDVFFSPGHYAPRTAPMPTVVSVMDLAFLKMPQLFLKFKRGAKQLADWTEYSVNQARAVIAISAHTKQDVVATYRVKPSRVTVAYPGVDLKRFKPATPAEIVALKQKYRLPDRFILHVGTIQPRKNIVRLIKAFEGLPPKFKTTHLVLAGQTGWLTDEVEQTIDASPAKERIIRPGYIEDKDLPILMSAAKCLVLVGLYEGFGMPPAEALAAGTIPVVSNNTSLPEVVGEAGVKVDPYSIANIRHGIIVVLDLDDAHRQARLILGRKYIEQFNWQRSAEKVIDVLQKL